MKNSAPLGLGICVVAGLFGFIGGAVSFVAFDWSFFGALVLAAIIAIIVAIVLMFGWREPASGPVEPGTAGIGAGNAPAVKSTGGAGSSAAAASSTTATSSTSAEASSAAQAVDPQITTDAEVKADAEKASAATAVDPQIATDGATAPKVKAATTLSGEDELASRKGDWKYEGDAADTAAEPAKKAPAKKAAAKKPAATTSGADKDYDGDGVAEGENEGSKPALLTAARDGGADNLKEIKGVGPKMETMLNEMGVYHFDQVAGWSGDEVAWVDANLKGFKGRVSRDGWVDQAKILAAGGETEFSKKVDKGGVY